MHSAYAAAAARAELRADRVPRTVTRDTVPPVLPSIWIGIFTRAADEERLCLRIRRAETFRWIREFGRRWDRERRVSTRDGRDALLMTGQMFLFLERLVSGGSDRQQARDTIKYNQVIHHFVSKK